MDGLLSYDFMQRALIAAVLIGLTAPTVGVYLVQRRLSLVGDGMGHVALTGVAVGLLTSSQPVWTALAATVIGAVTLEVLRVKGRTSGDVALAVLFYGGIAGGVVLIAKAPPTAATNLEAYLFGSITTTSNQDLVVFTILAAVVLAASLLLSRLLFAVGGDEEYARAAGLPVLALNLLLAVLVAVTVVVAMRVVGLLLVSALMILPVATAQKWAKGFLTTLVAAMALGIAVSLGGVVASYYAETPSGGTIVVVAVALFLLASIAAASWSKIRGGHTEAEEHLHRHGPDCGHPAVPHGDHVDYLHHGHRHAPHGAHYDEH